MSSLIELHPIFANTVPAEDSNPVHCVIHECFLESLQQADEEEAAELLEASYCSTASEVFSPSTKSDYPADPGNFDEAYEMIDNMLTIDMDIITSCIIENDSQCSLPSLTDDGSDSDESNDSDVEVPAPAPLSISPSRGGPQAQPLTVAVIPQPSGVHSTPIPPTPRLRPRTFTNPLPAFLSSRLAPTLASPKLNTQFTTTPKKRVHFHPNTSTRSFSAYSYAADFQTSTFSPITQPSPVNDIALRRQRKKARVHGNGERGRQRQRESDRKAEGLRTFPRTCVKDFLDRQHGDSPHPCPEHESVQFRYDALLSRLQRMHTTFITSLSSPSPSATPTLLKAAQLHAALTSDLTSYLTSSRYITHSPQRTAQKMSSCADTCDVETFEDTAQVFARCLERLLLDFWRGERESAEMAVEALLVDGWGGSSSSGEEEDGDGEEKGEESMMDQM